jgi:hypothetical protein
VFAVISKALGKETPAEIRELKDLAVDAEFDFLTKEEKIGKEREILSKILFPTFVFKN